MIRRAVGWAVAGYVACLIGIDWMWALGITVATAIIGALQ